jgi:hypothetical protein
MQVYNILYVIRKGRMKWTGNEEVVCLNRNTSHQKLATTLGTRVKAESCQIYLILVLICQVRFYIPYSTPKRKQTVFLKWFVKTGTLIKILTTMILSQSREKATSLKCGVSKFIILYICILSHIVTSLSLSWFSVCAACQCLKHFIVFSTLVTL